MSSSTFRLFENISLTQGNAKKGSNKKTKPSTKPMVSPEQHYLTRVQLAGFYFDVDQAVKISEGAILNDMDFYHTFWRNAIVFSATFANGMNDDSYTPHSKYEILMKNNAWLQWTAAGISIPVAILGAYLKYREMKISRTMNTTQYQLKKMQAVNADVKTDEDVLIIMNDLISRGKVKPSFNLVSPPAKEELLKTEELLSTKDEDKEQTTVKKSSLLSRIGNGLANAFYTVADKLRVGAFIFWPIWFVAVLLTSIGTIYAAPVAGAIIAATLVTTGIYLGVTGYFKNKKNKVDAEQKKYFSDEAAEELKLMREKLKMRAHMKAEHAAFNKLHGITKVAKNNAQPASEYVATATKKDGVIVFVKNTHVASVSHGAASAYLANETQTEKTAELEAVKNSALYKKLIGSKKERVTKNFLTSFFTMMGQYTLVSFILWLIGVFFIPGVLVLAPAVAVYATAISNIVLSGLAMTGVGALVGVIAAVKAAIKSYSDEKATEKFIQNALLEKYQGKTPIPGIANPNMQQAFDHYYNQVVERQARVQAALDAKRKDLATKKVDDMSALDKEHLKLNVKTWANDAYNNHYFKTQEKKPTLGQRIYNVGTYVFGMLSSMQTWVFVSRTLFLVGGVFGMSLIMPPMAFLGVALGLSFVIGAGRGLYMYLNNRADEHTFFAKTIKERVSYLKKKDKELMKLEQELGLTPAAAPAADSGADLTASKVNTLAAAPNVVKAAPAADATVSKSGMFAQTAVGSDVPAIDAAPRIEGSVAAGM